MPSGISLTSHRARPPYSRDIDPSSTPAQQRFRIGAIEHLRRESSDISHVRVRYRTDKSIRIVYKQSLITQTFNARRDQMRLTLRESQANGPLAEEPRSDQLRAKRALLTVIDQRLRR
jgi:hypothetical protein